MTRLAPRLPLPADGGANGSLRNPPVPGMTAPASGRSSSIASSACRSSSLTRSRRQSETNVASCAIVSCTCSTLYYTVIRPDTTCGRPPALFVSGTFNGRRCTANCDSLFPSDLDLTEMAMRTGSALRGEIHSAGFNRGDEPYWRPDLVGIVELAILMRHGRGRKGREKLAFLGIELLEKRTRSQIERASRLAVGGCAGVAVVEAPAGGAGAAAGVQVAREVRRRRLPAAIPATERLIILQRHGRADLADPGSVLPGHFGAV